ncbi:MAG: NAD(+) synthase [Bacteroidales bacterium]|nr:NAD(+) synthase [Bacteroidales bacterium]
MKDYGFFRVAAAAPSVKPSDVKYNLEQIVLQADAADAAGVSLLVFPELSVTGYTCADLFGQQLLLRGAEDVIEQLKTKSLGWNATIIVGVPVPFMGRLYNCAAVISRGHIHGLVPKIYLPDYNEFYEGRWFSSGKDFMPELATVFYAGEQVELSPLQMFKIGKAVVAVEICEDLWTPLPPSSYHALCGATVIANLSASNEVLLKHAYRKDLISNQSARTSSAYVYASSGFGESTQDLVFAGSSVICENGSVLAENERFQTSGSFIIADVDLEKLDALRRKQSTFGAVAPDGMSSAGLRPLYNIADLGNAADTDFESALYRYIEPLPFVPGGNPAELDSRAREIISIQVAGLATRLSHINCKTAVIGISGGLDSTLALLVTVMAFDKLGLDRRGVYGVTMPGFGTTDRTYNNAISLMQSLGITLQEIPIGAAVMQHFSDIGQNPDNHDVTYENSQARERTQILMDLANKLGGIVVGTGDLSELALGWATYNGDHMSMYGVNAGVPKTLVRYLVGWASANYFATTGSGASAVLNDIIDTPISPELIPAGKDGEILQKTEDLVGPYELHDFFLYNFFRFGYTPDKLFFLAKKAHGGYPDYVIRKWLRTFLRRFFNQQFKRSCLPDGPKVGSVALSPRGDLRMPSDASSNLWLSDASLAD